MSCASSTGSGRARRRGRHSWWSASSRSTATRARGGGRRGRRRHRRTGRGRWSTRWSSPCGRGRDGGDRGVRRGDGRRVGERRPVHRARRDRLTRDTGTPPPGRCRTGPRCPRKIRPWWRCARRGRSRPPSGGLGRLGDRLLGAVHSLGGDGLGSLGDLLLHGLAGLDRGGDELRRETPLGGQHLLGEVEVSVHDGQRVGSWAWPEVRLPVEALNQSAQVRTAVVTASLAALGDVDELVGRCGHRPRPL